MEVARWNDDIVEDASLQEMLGKGSMPTTLTPDEGERYQGIVSLDHVNLAACLEEYFNQSEQLPTQIQLFANGKQAAGMLLQVLPSKSDQTDDFEHLAALTATIKAEELFTLDAEQVLHRLYHQEEVRLFDPVDVTFKCSCSYERSGAAIKTLSQHEVEAILAEDGKIEMDCEYCTAKYAFDAIDIAALYSGSHSSQSKQ